MKKLVTSAHIMELFMPYLDDEKRVLGVIDRLRGFDFYHGVKTRKRSAGSWKRISGAA